MAKGKHKKPTLGMSDPQIKASLIRLLEAIKRSDGPALGQEMESLETAAAAKRKELHPQLVHFIERRSYAKALAFVEAEDSGAR